MKIGNFQIGVLHLFLVFVPITAGLKMAHAGGTWIFIFSGLAIIPLAGLLGQATEHLAEHVGPGVGGLLNATFGNAAELIIAVFALQAGLYGVVKASTTGSIIGSILLVLGASMVAGGLKYKTQSFNPLAAGMNSTRLLLSTAGLIVPALLLAPLLVFLSYFIGPAPMDLVFSPLEVVAIILSAVLVNFVALDGKSHWMQGVQLLAVYFVLGFAFYFLPPW